jgi:uncharacterized protein DUF5658
MTARNLFVKPVAQRRLMEPLAAVARWIPERLSSTEGLRENRQPLGRSTDRQPPRDHHARRTGPGRHQLPLGKLALFAMLGVADVYLTWQLVQAGGGQVYEVNPLAEVWLQSFGWVGLLVFKGLAILLVSLSSLYVSRHRPRTGARLLTFACLATGLVVGYSCYLGLRADSFQTTATNDILCAEQKFRLLDRELERQKQHQDLVKLLRGELESERLSLDEAVNHLVQTDRIHDARWMGYLHRAYPDRSDAECLALHLIRWVLQDLRRDPAARLRLASRLEAEYRATYGREVEFDLTEETGSSRRLPSPESLRNPQARIFPPRFGYHGGKRRFATIHRPRDQVGHGHCNPSWALGVGVGRRVDGRADARPGLQPGSAG